MLQTSASIKHVALYVVVESCYCTLSFDGLTEPGVRPVGGEEAERGSCSLWESGA